jgi:hypothetical protein
MPWLTIYSARTLDITYIISGTLFWDKRWFEHSSNNMPRPAR